MDRDILEDGDDSSQRKRQRSCSCESDLKAKRRLQQTDSPRNNSDASDMNFAEDDLSEDGGAEDEILAMIASHNAAKLGTNTRAGASDGEDEILAMIAKHNAAKLGSNARAGVDAQRRTRMAGPSNPSPRNCQQASPSSWNARVGLTPRDGNLRKSHGQTRSATKRHTRSSRRNDENDQPQEADIAALIAAHNQKFRPKYEYAPPQHSVRDVKAWEAETGQRWYKLSPNARIRANEQISKMKIAART